MRFSFAENTTQFRGHPLARLGLTTLNPESKLSRSIPRFSNYGCDTTT